MTNLSLRRAGPGEELARALVGAATFLDAYIHDIPGPDLIPHCTRQHSRAAYRDFLTESDPRWAKLADTGIIEASWQGDQLVIRGLNQRELMQVNASQSAAQSISKPFSDGRAGRRVEKTLGKAVGSPLVSETTCYYCRHLRGQRCRNPESPLVGLQVTSDGTCGVFERSATSL